MLFERVTSSVLSNTASNFHDDGAVIAPYVTISDMASLSGSLIFRHFISRSLMDKNIGTVIVLCLEHSSSYWNSQLSNLQKRFPSIFQKLKFIDCPTSDQVTSEVPGFASLKFQLKDYSIDSLTSALAPHVIQANETSSSVLVFIDSVSHILLQNNPGTYSSWIEDMRISGAINGIVTLLHTDCLSINSGTIKQSQSISSYPIFNDQTSTEEISASLRQFVKSSEQIPNYPASSSSADIVASPPPHGVYILHTIFGLSTTFIQVLLPSAATTSSDTFSKDQSQSLQQKPKNQKKYFVACRVYHKRPTGKVTNFAESLYPLPSTSVIPTNSSQLNSSLNTLGPLKGVEYAFADTIRRSTSSSDNSKDSNYSAIRKLTGALPFNLEMTDKQRLARGRIELPYMHQGQIDEEDPSSMNMNENDMNFQDNSNYANVEHSNIGVLDESALSSSIATLFAKSDEPSITSTGFVDNIDYDEYEVVDDFGDDEEI